MDSIWTLLGIEETKDVDNIKDTYRNKLVGVNPEDDAEGFKALRAAYEAAIQWTKTSAANEQIVVESLTDLDIWIKKVEEIYQNFFKRRKVSCWEEILQEDICISLDTSNEARERLLGFLMDNFRLPYKVWKGLEECFHFIEDREELCEKFPKEFIDYVVRSVSSEEFLDYTLFEGDEDRDYDGFISNYFKLKNSLDEGNGEDFQALYAECKDSFIYHPYLMVEEARFYTKQQDYEKAEKILSQIYESHSEDNYILYYLCDVYLKAGKVQEAIELYKLLLERDPKHYSGKLGLAQCHILNKAYESAKEIYLDILEVYQGDNYVSDKLQEVNEFLIEEYRNEYEEDRANIKALLELGWCLCQNGKHKETIQLLDRITPDAEHEFEYNNLKGRSLLYHEDYERALPYLLKWLDELEAIEPADNPENQKKRRRIGYAYYAIGCTYAELPGENKCENMENALKYLDNAYQKEINNFEKLGYQNQKALVLYQLERYEQCVDICDKILEESAYYYPACVRRQEAYFKLKRYQDVIDDYYRAIDIYAKEAKPYVLAAKTFLQFDKYEDALAVVERAEQEEVVFDQLIYYKAKIIRVLAKDDAAIKKAYELVAELKNKGKENNLERKGDAWYEGALCKLELNELDAAMEEINTAILLYPSEGDYQYCKANILFNQKKYKEAQDLYEQLKEKYPDSDTVLFKLGRVYDLQNDMDTALSYYLKVLELYPEHGSVNHYIAVAYEVLGERKYDNAYYEKALLYYTKQIEVNPNDYNYIERGLLLAKVERFEEAIEDYKKAIEYNPENPYPYNNMGFVYKCLKDYDEAISCFLMAVERMGDNKNMRPFTSIASCYSMCKEYDKAEKYYLENVRVFSDREDSYTELAEFYRSIKVFDKAIKVYEQAKEKLEEMDEAGYLVNLADTYTEQGEYKKAESLYKKVMKRTRNSSGSVSSYAEFCLYGKLNYKKSIRLYKKAIKICDDTTNYNYFEYLYTMGRAYYYLGKKEKAKEILQKVLDDYYIHTYGSLENYINVSGYKPIRCYRIATIYYYLGELEKAKELYERMTCKTICKKCSYPECYEALIGKGLLLEAEGKSAKALSYYQEADTIESDIFCQFLIMRLKKAKKL